MNEFSEVSVNEPQQLAPKSLTEDANRNTINDSEILPTPLTSSMERAFIAELRLQIPKVQNGDLTRDKFDAFLEEIKGRGVDQQTIELILQAGDIEYTPPLSEDIKRAGLAELSLQASSVVQGNLSIVKIQEYIDELKARGWNIQELRTVLENAGITVLEGKQANGNEKASPLSQDEISEMKNRAHRKLREYEQAEVAWEDTPTDLSIERSKLPESIGVRFKAHGIAKSRPLDALLNLLSSGIDPNKSFYTIDLKKDDENEIAGALGAAGPYDTGGFIVISPPHEKNQVGLEIDISSRGIAGVLVNREWYDAIPRLEQAFPTIRFIRADQMQSKLAEWLNETGKVE